ncbi:MAG: hypothetical protein Q9169_007106 [Polycauliona sp. 2 TL-2023]
MSQEPTRTAFFRDLSLGMLNSAIGRFLPTLQVPQTDLGNKVAIVTGGNSGIGFQIALELARQGATVHLACRNASKVDIAISQITSQVPGSSDRVFAHSLDTSSLASVRAFAQEWKTRVSDDGRIDIMMHNAGVASVPEGQDPYTPDGFPLLYETNFLGPFVLTHLLEPHFAVNARIIFTASVGHYTGEFADRFALDRVTNRMEPGFHYPDPGAPLSEGEVPGDNDIYNNTKLMQVTFSRLLQQRFDRKAAESGQRSQRIVHSFSPGFASTPMVDKLNIRSFQEDPVWWVLQTIAIFATHPQQGAATGVWLASTQDEEVVGEAKGGGYWDRMTSRVSKIDVTKPEIGQRLWVRWEADAGIEWR